MKPMRIAAFAIAAAAAALAGCGEQPQVIAAGDHVQGTRVSSTSQPWQGDALTFQTGKFTRGDEASWDKALDHRMQGQNEYIRIGGAQ
jgi:hypothetical protein